MLKPLIKINIHYKGKEICTIIPARKCSCGVRDCDIINEPGLKPTKEFIAFLGKLAKRKWWKKYVETNKYTYPYDEYWFGFNPFNPEWCGQGAKDLCEVILKRTTRCGKEYKKIAQVILDCLRWSEAVAREASLFHSLTRVVNVEEGIKSWIPVEVEEALNIFPPDKREGKILFWNRYPKSEKVSFDGISLSIDYKENNMFSLIDIIPFVDVNTLYLGNDWEKCKNILGDSLQKIYSSAQWQEFLGGAIL